MVMTEEYVVSVACDEEPEAPSALGVIGVIWYELSGGVGPWGALRPLVALALSLVPFLYLYRIGVSEYADSVRSGFGCLRFRWHYLFLLYD